MADKKAEPKKKAVQKKQVKASTGAWWKSTAKVETKEETPESGKSKKKTAGTTAKKDSTVKKETTPAKKRTPTAGRKKKPAPRKKPAAKAKPKKASQKAKQSLEAPKAVEPDDATPLVDESQKKTKAESEKSEIAKSAEPEKKTSRSAGRKTQKAKSSDKKKQEKEPAEKPVPKEKPQVLKLLINAEEPEECRLALLADGRLESIHVSTVSSKQTKNNIYKARIVAMESNLQAAFVDYGTDKNGFLPFNEIHPEYYKQEISEENKRLIQQHQWKKLRITEVLERGQEVLVQVVKEEVGNKGANMTTYLSIPGRSVVLMPGSDSSGISRKISGEERRSQLRDIMASLNIPEGVGWIVRTASVDITKTALTKDVRYLSRLWKEIKLKGQNLDGVGMVYQDHDCVLRFLREYFDPDLKEILVDDLAALEKVKDFLEVLPTKQRGAIARLHKGSRPIF